MVVESLVSRPFFIVTENFIEPIKISLFLAPTSLIESVSTVT